jgi:hypothetical protein
MTQNNTTNANAAGAGAYVRAAWRRTGMGGVTHPVALRLEGNRLHVVRPLWEEYSKTHSHGTFYYPTQIDVLLYLEASNSGKRSVRIALCRLEPQQCRAVEAAAWDGWIIAGAAIRQVERRLEGLKLYG